MKMFSGLFNLFGGTGGSSGVSSLDALNGVAYNTMMIHDLHEVDGIEMGDAYITSFESDDQGPGSAATYDAVEDTYDTAYAGRKSVGSIDFTSTDDPSCDTLTIDGDALISSSVESTPLTTLDGASYTTTTDAALKIAGAQAWCAEVYIDSTQVNSQSSIMSNRDTGNSEGLSIIWIESSNTLYFTVSTGGGATGASVVDATLKDKWIKIVGYYDGTNVKLYVDDTLEDSQVGGLVTSTENFNVGVDGFDLTNQRFTGNIKNSQVYSGTVTDPTLWDPTDTSSMTGQASAPTLVMESPNGSGDDNDQSIAFTEVGSPTITDGLLSALVTAVNAGPLSASWVASTTSSTNDGTLTLTAAAVGDNDGLAIAGTGTNTVLSNAVDTADGYGASPETAAPSVGSIDMSVDDVAPELTAFTLDGVSLIDTGATPIDLLTSGAVLDLKMDDASLTDSSGSEHTTTLVGSITNSTTEKKFGTSSASFNGSTQEITVGNDNDFDFGSGDLTISMFVWFDAVNSKTLLYNETLNSSGMVLSTNASGNVQWRANHSAGNVTLITSAAVSTGQWEHLKFTRIGNTFSIQINGTEYDTDTMTQAMGTPVKDLQIGNDNSNQRMDGYIDELYILKGTGEAPGVPTSTLPDNPQAVVAANINDYQSDWVATYSGDTITLTAATDGVANDGQTPAATGNDVTFSGAVDTTGGADANYIGNIAIPIVDITGKTKTSALITFSHKWLSGSGTVGTDCVAEVTKDGANWATATSVTDLGATLSGTEYKYYSGEIEMSTLTGNDFQGRIRDLSTGQSALFSLAVYAIE